MKKTLLALGAIMALSAFSPAQANKVDWKVCAKEMEKFCKAVDAKDDEAVWACLQKHDIDLSKTCDVAHGEYEKLSGKKK